ncbi:hypothetical protein CEXT_170161 [Caerostris extrusa]|uniref:Uncharacterized protein n=1 Tax=Caerostris extrusa TaxID=172846 RepID=A0AAV4M4A3_CAEEX|nr:hypothetical protein CEXT_170161 [Caerostris extrusa]
MLTPASGPYVVFASIAVKTVMASGYQLESDSIAAGIVISCPCHLRRHSSSLISSPTLSPYQGHIDFASMSGV